MTLWRIVLLAFAACLCAAYLAFFFAVALLWDKRKLP